MQSKLADQLIASVGTDFDSELEWPRTQRFVYHALFSVRWQLPAIVRECINQRGPELPRDEELAKFRVQLWESIKSDSMGTTAQGASVRAALFAFSRPSPEGPGEVIHYFCTYYLRAGLPTEALVAAFKQQWPQVGA